MLPLNPLTCLYTKIQLLYVLYMYAEGKGFGVYTHTVCCRFCYKLLFVLWIFVCIRRISAVVCIRKRSMASEVRLH